MNTLSVTERQVAVDDFETIIVEVDERENNVRTVAVVNVSEYADKFAASPLLLEALEDMVIMTEVLFEQINWGKSFLNAEGIRRMNEAPIQARAAIAKAKGEEVTE